MSPSSDDSITTKSVPWYRSTDPTIRCEFRLHDFDVAILRDIALPGDTVADAIKRIIRQSVQLETDNRALQVRQQVLDKRLQDMAEAFFRMSKTYQLMPGLLETQNSALTKVREAVVSIAGDVKQDRCSLQATFDIIGQHYAEVREDHVRTVSLHDQLESIMSFLNGVLDGLYARLPPIRRP